MTGHWEMMGIVLDRPFPTFPDGFSADLIAEFERRIGRGTIGNVVASGTEIIERLGPEHVRTGKPIVYTSADSVFQIAAHEDGHSDRRAVPHLRDRVRSRWRGHGRRSRDCTAIRWRAGGIQTNREPPRLRAGADR